ncbi:MarR family transcriptional regulator [Sulfurifustis variabilis]|uniref:MarR family transcriptional regulator n=1 Tax=Sulfurifustis variabilis TaxID=1675686 RepID=A0A1B4VCZ3_9GAMM|nr:MarR family winged helix-turn-helix transcriptional regulator [Sulfurifustis variabilis]BAU47107.1 MarR family transcriptional regulator [Sulfurifustis variabilis]
MSGSAVLDRFERLAHLLVTETRRAAAAHGLVPVHVEVLGYLARCNRYSDTPGAVTEYLGLTKGTVSQTLALLNARGLVRKQADARNRRVVHLELTRKGHAVLERVTLPPAWRRAAARLEQGVPDLALRLETMLRELQRAHGGRTFGVSTRAGTAGPTGRTPSGAD